MGLCSSKLWFSVSICLSRQFRGQWLVLWLQFFDVFKEGCCLSASSSSYLLLRWSNSFQAPYMPDLDISPYFFLSFFLPFFFPSFLPPTCSLSSFLIQLLSGTTRCSRLILYFPYISNSNLAPHGPLYHFPSCQFVTCFSDRGKPLITYNILLIC